MAVIPESVKESKLTIKIFASGFKRIAQGKTCDVFSLPGYDDLLLVVATDRISIHDFVLNAVILKKGEIRTAWTVFWLTQVLNMFDSHLVAYGIGIDEYLPKELRNNPYLQKRALVVKNLDILPVECIVRNYLTGSAWKAYQKDGKVAGVFLPSGLKKGSELFESIFDPTTKAESGHDKKLSPDFVVERYGSQIKEWSLGINDRITNLAKSKGFIFADHKMEFGSYNNCLYIADELGTSDSSRIWEKEDWEKAIERNEMPTAFDKQPVRDWGEKVKTPFGTRGEEVGIISGLIGIDKLNPASLKHCDFVHSLKIPGDLLDQTTIRYRYPFSKLTGFQLEDFQQKVMGIKQDRMDPVNCYD